MHTKRSPSQAKRFGECSGTLALCAVLPEHQRNLPTDAGRIGTCVHKLVEQCLRHGEEPSTYRGRIIEIQNEGEADEDAVILPKKAKTPGAGRLWFEVDDAMIDGATMMTDYVRQRCEELGVKESDLQLETRTNPLPDRDDTSGTADVTLDAWPLFLEVADYKNGYLKVDAEDNDQLRAYLLGKALEAGMTHERYRVTVIQPNYPHEKSRIRPVEMTKEELLAFQKVYAKRIAKCEEAEDADGSPVADGSPGGFHYTAEWSDKYLKGGDHCTFCDAKAICPAYVAWANAEAAHDFAAEPDEIPLPITEAGIGRILAWAPKFEALFSAAAAWAQRAMEAGHIVPGQKLVRGRSNRVLIEGEPDKLAKAIVGEGFVSDAKTLFTEPKLLTGPQIEKLVERKRRKDFGLMFLVKPEGQLTIAPESDPREAVSVRAGADFEDAEPDFG